MDHFVPPEARWGLDGESHPGVIDHIRYVKADYAAAVRTDPGIRPARPEEAPAVLDIVRAAFEKYVPRIGREPYPMGVDYGEPIARGQCWVTGSDERITGMLVLIDEDGYLHLETIAVAPAAQGQGVGGRLLAFAEDRACAAGLDEVRLYTNEKMTENLAFYARHGYRETHRDEQHGFRRVFFTKRVLC
jgi:ribosomal protein S18 acetylase RimI-like enzyme